MDSPFLFGKLVGASTFVNRTSEQEKLSKNLSSGINTIIISPRRWGKSSLVEKVALEIAKKQAHKKVVRIDLFTLSSEEEFLEAFAREVIKASSNKWNDWLLATQTFLKSISPKMSIGADPTTEFSIGFDWKERQKNRNEILDLPNKIGKEKSIDFIICLDEFQSIVQFTHYTELEKAMRAIWQRQKNATYCLYGSKRHMMADIFDSSSRPFYRFGEMMMLDKIEKHHWVPFIQSAFKKTKRKIELHAAERICDLMKNHSWYVQQLAHNTWVKTDELATINTVHSALRELLSTNMPLYQMETENLSKTQLQLLLAIAKNVSQLTSMETIREFNIGTSNNILKNKNILIEKDIIQSTPDGFEFMDSAFELWFKWQYLRIEPK